MSVRVEFLCAFGNNLFQYVAARLFAEHHDLKLTSDFAPQITPHSKGNHGRDVLLVSAPADGLSVDAPEVEINDSTKKDLFDRDWPKARYTFKGFFQKTGWYLPRVERIREFIHPDPVAATNTQDIVINLRIGPDYRGLQYALHPSWYLDILKREKFARLHIVADELEPSYLKYFAHYNPILVSSGAKGDFNYLRQFDRVIAANSSFSWWACFFSDASKIYTHKRWVRADRRAFLPPDALDFQPFPGGEAVDGPFIDEMPV